MALHMYLHLARYANTAMLNKNSLAVKKCEANQKQHCSYSYKRPKSLISGKAKKIQ